MGHEVGDEPTRGRGEPKPTLPLDAIAEARRAPRHAGVVSTPNPVYPPRGS